MVQEGVIPRASHYCTYDYTFKVEAGSGGAPGSAWTAASSRGGVGGGLAFSSSVERSGGLELEQHEVQRLVVWRQQETPLDLNLPL